MFDTEIVRANLFNDMHRVHFGVVSFRIRCLGHRLRSFGFEETVNRISPRERIALSCWMPRNARVVLCISAYNDGTYRERQFLRKYWPEQFEVAPTKAGARHG